MIGQQAATVTLDHLPVITDQLAQPLPFASARKLVWNEPMALREPTKVSRAQRRAASIEAQEGWDRVQDVLCEPARLRIIAALKGEELTVGDLAAAIGRKVPATSQHLRLLRELGLVEGERRGTAVYYRLRPGPATEQCQAVLDALTPQDPAAS